jgi:hypothetical protein
MTTSDALDTDVECAGGIYGAVEISLELWLSTQKLLDDGTVAAIDPREPPREDI